MSYSLTKSAYCVEYFYAKKDCKTLLIEGLLKLVPLTREEEGCLQYELFEDNRDPNLVILLVKFSDKDSLAQHEQQDFVIKFIENEMKKYCEKLVWNSGLGIE